MKISHVEVVSLDKTEVLFSAVVKLKLKVDHH
jgi:hypothetical protein